MARQAFEDAIAELDSVSEDSYKVRFQFLFFVGFRKLGVRFFSCVLVHVPIQS